MKRNAVEPTPLACAADAIPPTERSAHFALLRRLFGGAALEREALPEGYAFRFAPGDFEEVARFVANERKCCPFLTFEITVSPSEESVWLRMTGPEGTRAFLDVELPVQGG